MKIPMYQVDAFTNKLFHGNPAAVCPLESWPDDHTLQSIAAENNLSETAFFVYHENQYVLRWFTPTTEIDLGHATLASAYVIFNFIDTSLNKIEFSTKSGPLIVQQNDQLLSMDFPVRPAAPCPVPENLIEGLGMQPLTVLSARDYLVILGTEKDVRELDPDMNLLKTLDCVGIIVSAQGDDVDFVSRFFAPAVGVPEDPVTGSAHCTLIPYWSKILGKTQLHALQLSHRGGELFCEDRGKRMNIAGEAILYMQGNINI